jgi:hypothetical protein
LEFTAKDAKDAKENNLPLISADEREINQTSKDLVVGHFEFHNTFKRNCAGAKALYLKGSFGTTKVMP